MINTLIRVIECQWQSLAFTGSGPPAQYYATLGVDGTTIVVVGGNAKSASATEPVVYLLDCGEFSFRRIQSAI